MKKTLLAVALLALASTTSTFAQSNTPASDTTKNAASVTGQPQQPERKYVIYLTAQQISLLGQIMSSSTAPYVNVIALEKILNEQLGPQSTPDNTNANATPVKTPPAPPAKKK